MLIFSVFAVLLGLKIQRTQPEFPAYCQPSDQPALHSPMVGDSSQLLGLTATGLWLYYLVARCRLPPGLSASPHRECLSMSYQNIGVVLIGTTEGNKLRFVSF